MGPQSVGHGLLGTRPCEWLAGVCVYVCAHSPTHTSSVGVHSPTHVGNRPQLHEFRGRSQPHLCGRRKHLWPHSRERRRYSQPHASTHGPTRVSNGGLCAPVCGHAFTKTTDIEECQEKFIELM